MTIELKEIDKRWYLTINSMPVVGPFTTRQEAKKQIDNMEQKRSVKKEVKPKKENLCKHCGGKL